MTEEVEHHQVDRDKMMRHLSELERSYHITMKEYENITNISVQNNVANIRIIKNLFILNTLTHQVNKKHLMNAFENVDNTLISILKRNNTNFVLKLVAIFYLNLCTYTSYNIREMYGRLFEMTLNRSMVNSPSEMKRLHEHFLKNTLLFTSLILAHVHARIAPHLSSLIEYSKKIKKSETQESKYFYLECTNKIIKTAEMTPADSEKIYKFLKRQFNEKDELIKDRIVKCLTSMFIVYPEYSLLEFDFFVNCIIDDTYLSTYAFLVNLKHIIKLLTVMFCNCANVKYNRSINDHSAGKTSSREGADGMASFESGTTVEREDEEDEEEAEQGAEEEEKEENENDEKTDEEAKNEDKEIYTHEKAKGRNSGGTKTTTGESKKKSFFSDFLKIATDEIVSKISKIKLEEKEGGKNYIKLDHVDGFLFLIDNLFNRKIVRNKKSVLFVYDFASFIVFFKRTLLNMFSDFHHDYTELKKLHFLRKLDKFAYYADVLHHFGTDVFTHGGSGAGDGCGCAGGGKVYEFFRKQKKGTRMRAKSAVSTYPSASVAAGGEASDSDWFINYLLEKDYKLMKGKEPLRYNDLHISIEEKKIFETYCSLVSSTLLRSIFFQSFKNFLSFSKKFSGKSVIKIIKLFLHLLDVTCTNCSKKKNIKNPLHTNNIANSFEINFLLFYFIDIVEELVRKRKRDPYTIVKEKVYKARQREKQLEWEKEKQMGREIERERERCKMDGTKEHDHRAGRRRTAHEKEENGRKNFAHIGNENLSEAPSSSDPHGGKNDSSWYNPRSSTSSQNGRNSTNGSKRKKELTTVKRKSKRNEEKNIEEEDNKVRTYIQNQVKNYLIQNNDTNMDVNEKKKNNILLKGLIILYTKAIVNNRSIKKGKYDKYESFLKIILNNMNGVHIDIDLVRHIIHLFVKIFLKFPQYTYNLITLLVNYITIINANFMTSLTLNTFDDIEKQVSILIISSVSLENILFSSSRFYRLYHLNNLILCVFDICKLFLSKVQTHPLKTINELRKIISFSLIHAITCVVVYEEVRNRRSEGSDKQIGRESSGVSGRERISEEESRGSTTPERTQEHFAKHEPLYDNVLFKLLMDILREMLNEIEEEKMQRFISSYEEQIKKKKMNSMNFFIVDNLFILVYILKSVHTILASDILTFFFFDHIYKIVQTLFDFLRQIYQAEKDHYHNGCENYEAQVVMITPAGKGKGKSINSGNYSKREGKKSFHFFEYGFTQMCRLINIENVFLIFLIYMLKIFCRVFKFVKQKMGKGAKNAGLSEGASLGKNGTNMCIESVEEPSPREGSYCGGNYKQGSRSTATTITATGEVATTTANVTFVTVPPNQPFAPIWEALIQAKSREGAPFDVFLDLLIYLVKNKDKDNFNNAVINILQREEENRKAKKKRKKTTTHGEKRKRQLFGEDPELDILNMLTNNYEAYYELVLIHFVQLFQLYVEKKKYFNVIIKNIYRCLLNVELNRNEFIIYLLILDNFLKAKFFNKKKGKIFKCMLPIFNVLNNHFVNPNSGLLNALLIKNLTHFICHDDNIDAYIFSYLTKLYQAYSRQILQEQYLCIVFSTFLKSVILSYIKIEDNNSYVMKNVITATEENRMANVGGTFPSSNLTTASLCSSTFLDTPSSTPSRSHFAAKGREINNFKRKRTIFTLENFRTLDLFQLMSFLGQRMRRRSSKRIKRIEFNNREKKGKLEKCSSSGVVSCGPGKINHVDRLAHAKLFSQEKGKILEFFDTYLNMLKVIPHDNKVFALVLRNFNVVVRKMNTRVNLYRIRDCLDVVLAYILKAENANMYRFEIERGGGIIGLFNNLLRVLRKGGMRSVGKGGNKAGVKKGHRIPTCKERSTKKKLSASQRQTCFEVESNVLNIFEIFLICYEKKTDRRLFTTINSMFHLVKRKKMEKFMSKISILIQRNIFLERDRNKIHVAIKCVYKLLKRKVHIPLSENFDYHLLVIYHHSEENLDKCFTDLLKMRILTYGFYNVNQWTKLFDRILNAKNMFLYDLIKYRSKGRYAKYESHDCNKNSPEQDSTKENNLLTNEKQPNEELKSCSTFHTSLFRKHFAHQTHINLKEENERKGRNKAMYFFNVFKLRQSDLNFSFETKHLVMKLLLFFLKTVSLSPLAFVHNDAYYVSYVKKRLKEGPLSGRVPANGQERPTGGRIGDAGNLKAAARERYTQEGSPSSSGGGSSRCTRRSHSSDSSCSHLGPPHQASAWNKMSKTAYIPPRDKFCKKEGNDKRKDQISYIEDVLIRRCLKGETEKWKSTFNNIDIENILDKFSLYDNFEPMLNIILHNINHGIRFDRLSGLAIKALIRFLKIFKSSKIILDEFSSTPEIMLLTNYEINIFTSLKMYYESFHFLYFSYLDGHPLGEDNPDAVGDKPNEHLQFSHFFLHPLMRVYNLFLFLNEIGLCNSHSKFVEYFFYFAMKGDHAVREQLAECTQYGQEKSEMTNGDVSMNGHHASNGGAPLLVGGRKKIPTINSSLFFSEFDSCVYYLFSYKSFCLYVINSEKAQRNQGIFNIKTVVKNISYILYDTIVLYFWSFGNDRGGEDCQEQVVHRFFTCMNEKARSLSIFYFSAFTIFLQFLNIIRRSNNLVISAKNCTLFKTLIYFLCYHLKEHKDRLKEETKEIYFSFILGYLTLTGFVSDLSHDVINTISEQGDVTWSETQLSSSVTAERREKKFHRIENSSKSNTSGDISKPLFQSTGTAQLFYDASRTPFLKTVLDYVLKNLVILVNEKVLPSVLEFVSVAHKNFANVQGAGETHHIVLRKVFTLHFFVLGKFLTKRRYGDRSRGALFRGAHDGEMLTRLWNSVLSCYTLLERLQREQLEEGKAAGGEAAEENAADAKATKPEATDTNATDTNATDTNATDANATKSKMAHKIKALLQALFLQKMNLLKEEKLSTRLLKLFFQNSSESDVQIYLSHMKSYKGKMAKMVKDQDLPRLKLFYIKVIIFIYYINTTDMMDGRSRVYYTEEILDVFIAASRRMKMAYQDMGKQIKRTNISSKKKQEKNGHTKNQIIHSFLNVIKNIFTLLLKREDRIVSYFTHNLIKNGMLPIVLVNHPTDSVHYEELIPHNSYEEDIITYPVKILNSFFDTFISREGLVRKVLIPYVTFVHQVCRLCDANRIDITKSFLTLQTDGEKAINPLSRADERLAHERLADGTSCPQNGFPCAAVVGTGSGTMTIYFKEVTNVFRNIAFKNASFFKHILADITGEEKVMVYNLIKEAIAVESETEQRNKQEEEKLDFSFVN
ncbi:hypothetical protein C922_00511 [Plasmodium inui San Antonio 1]|uniref:Uncharacterized protein n=1 Tax=Plasmodium inui San Antonio 1 TaxID=1237626 RepID=W7ABX5_9APIC|nr:hypothetical protein C922_00511 [Plasmodium inui San Antonio 1]EUD68823.1 hypothetical protein C922_00511 [Plasmodium inui San Antonio 1]